MDAMTDVSKITATIDKVTSPIGAASKLDAMVNNTVKSFVANNPAALHPENNIPLSDK